VTVYVCMMRVLCNAVSWRRAPHIGQACLFPPSALFAEWILLLLGHAHASKSRQDTHLASQARWSRSRCSFPDRTGRLPSRRSQRPSVCLVSKLLLSWVSCETISMIIKRQPPKGEKDDYDSENSWISDGLPSSSRRRRRGDGRWKVWECSKQVLLADATQQTSIKYTRNDPYLNRYCFRLFAHSLHSLHMS